ncbi:MAG: ADP-forming succinate--CoA ligase subunit beta [Candidatus Bipolaricaulia bacterium]
MRLLEYQGKELFASSGIPVQEGKVANSPEEVARIARSYGTPVVVKAQVVVGGRGKAGGIQFAQGPETAEEHARKLLGSMLKGVPVEEVLVEQAIGIQDELYLGITLDRSTRKPVVIFSAEGGIDIEELAVQHPEAVFKFHVEPLEGIHAYQIRNLLLGAGIDRERFKPLADIIERLYHAFIQYEANLVEINPLAVGLDGGLIALDAKFIVDDDALYRHPELQRYRSAAVHHSPEERRAEEVGLGYVKLDGNIGIIGNGAGLVMATLDLVQLKGGRPANFLDIGGGADAAQMREALEIVISDEQVDGVFINIFGGITRGDAVAQGLIEANQALKAEQPLVVRLTGTNEAEGRRMLQERGIQPVEGMEVGAEMIVAEVEKIRKAR